MAGLLDGVLGASFDDPRTAATLALAQGLLTAPKAMQGLNGGLLGYQNAMAEAKKAKQMEEMRQMQLMQHQMALKQAERQAAQQAQQDAFRQSIPSPQFQTGVDALAANGGMKGALAPLPKADPNAELLHGAMKAGVIDPIQYITSQRKDNTPIKLGAGEALLDPKTLKPLFTNPKEDSTPTDWKLYQLSGAAERGIGFDQWDQIRRKASATNVRVDSGPKAFDTELGKFAVETFGKEREVAASAAATLQSVGEIRKAAQSGAYQGAGADLKLGAAKALGAIGMPYDARTVANSELFSAQANEFVTAKIKALGANPSNADREFIEKTVPRLQTDPAALPELLSFMERKAKSQLGAYNQKARTVKAGAPYLPFSLEVPEPEVGGGWSIKPIGGN